MILDEELGNRVGVVLNKLQIKNPVLLGKGGEGWIYEYGNDALKIYPRVSDITYLQNIQKFHIELAMNKFSFEIPQIFKIGKIDGILYTIEKRLEGVQMDKKIIGLNTSNRQKMYRNYYEAIRQVNTVSFPNLPFGQIIKTSISKNSDKWTDFLLKVLDQKVVKTQKKTRESISDFDDKVEIFKSLIQQYLRSDDKNLIHCDYFLNNVLVDENLVISAVLDFSVHSAVGDPRLDIAGVLTWNGIDPNVKPDDYMFLWEIAKKDYGEDIETYADLYLLFSSFYFADMDDPSFSIKNLNNTQLWQKYKY